MNGVKIFKNSNQNGDEWALESKKRRENKIKDLLNIRKHLNFYFFKHKLI
jgi:hypothetical protein